jgi:hypothetical protein
MVHLSHSLLFPSLVRQGEVNFKSWSSSKETVVFKLDWSKVEEIKKQRHADWLKKSWPDKNIPFFPSAPEPYNSWVESLEFAIPHRYLDEIRRTTHLSLLEWGTERHFDTMIREICLKPAEAYVDVAFRLIADCVYDRKLNYFYKGDDKFLVSRVMLYKFWSYQTGGGLVRHRARLEKTDLSFSCSEDEERDKIVKTVTDVFDAFEKEKEKAFNVIYENCPKLGVVEEGATAEDGKGNPTSKDNPA